MAVARKLGDRKRSSVSRHSRLSNPKEDISQIPEEEKIQYGDYKYLKYVKKNSVQESDKPSLSGSDHVTNTNTKTKNDRKIGAKSVVEQAGKSRDKSVISKGRDKSVISKGRDKSTGG